jgi:hypothetical protein
MNTENLKQLIRNLRRGDNLEESKREFFAEMENNISYWCSKLTLRWLVSLVDTYADHGTPAEQPRAMMVSIYFNMVKIADTSRLLTSPNRNLLPRLLDDVVFMYDEVNSLKITSDDMPNILFWRINNQLKTSPVLLALFEAIKLKLAANSQTMQIANYHKGFYEQIFFECRRHFLRK